MIGRTTRIAMAAIGLVLTVVASASADDKADAEALEARFRTTVRPFLASYCVNCHGPKLAEGDLDLATFDSAEAVAEELARWSLVTEQLDAKTMPPVKSKRQPSDDDRRGVIAWIGDVRNLEAKRHAGDPGAVPARRLSNAEYDYSIRDLTGFDIRPTREFPVDPANAAGFDNSGESLTTSPSLVKKQLEAARFVADHLVLTPTGLTFAPHPVIAETDRDKFSVNRIIGFYKQQRLDLADYFFAAWQEKHGQATDPGLSRRYLATIVELLADRSEEIGPVAAIRALFDALPDDADGARAGCVPIRDFVNDLRQQLVPEVKNLPTRGIAAGSQNLVLWKNRQFVANRMRYSGGADKVQPKGLDPEGPAAKALAIPEDPEAFARFEATFPRYCRVFPDTFLVSERARVFLDPKGEKGLTGRLLSAGFHNMMGYFRDDGPLWELVLDDDGRRELDRLWDEFDFVTDSPWRQYSGHLWYERAESGFVRGPEFDFVRAEDKGAVTEANMARFAAAYLDKARRVGVSDEAIAAVEEQFRVFAATIRHVERERAVAPPTQVAALQGLAERAYRRPLRPEERDGIAAFYRSLREDDGLAHDDAVRDTLVAILMSPHFGYRVDLPTGDEGIRPLSDLDLASRLSYFLWSSLPDRELLDRAASGELHKPDVLAAQSRRMLRDDRARALAVEFGGGWLDFRRFEEHNSVDRGRFPTFDDELRRSMYEEPVRFLDDVFRNDHSIISLVDGKHTFLNPALAKHYGLPHPGGGPDIWIRVDDATGVGRGGLMPMAAFLTKNSPGLRTSPVKRGYWVVRRLLGEAIPAPPANVPDLPEDEAKAELSLREALARHRADVACAGCHERFDAIGLAFEGYGPVGEARTLDLGGRPVDTRAAFPKGGEGQGIEGLRAYVLGVRKNDYLENFCRKLLAYALGRTLIPSDEATVHAMRARLSADGGRFGGLVETIVTSPQFLNKRVESETAE